MIISEKHQRTILIKKLAEQEGFADCRIALAERLDDQEGNLKAWLDAGYHGSMTYMENHFEKRLDPRLLMEGTKSVIVFAQNYYTEDETSPDVKIAKYAFGRDYHKVLKGKMKRIAKALSDEFPEFTARSFVDSAPVMERQWAEKSGLGWLGKNTLLIHPKRGSYYFLAVMLTTLDLTADEPISDFCGTCRRCIDACPTDAIKDEGYILEAERCISYLTIENKDEIPSHFKDQMENWAFGCDICQEVCPWNRFAKEHDEPDFSIRDFLKSSGISDWQSLDEVEFATHFNGSPIKRTGYTGMKRNIDFIADNEA